MDTLGQGLVIALPILILLCRNPSLGLVTKAKACKGEGQEGSLGVASHALGSVTECEGTNLHAPK
jgi:hypothetical protein